ncbi:ABC transporter ATP-binding protein [Pseudochryseolinea flava]|uniref:ABC transporter ATP-binding protein n=1 Tax=Pseudochryseolinea flava TaxID=2059302 RepID=A0A364XZV9_9BACT|nr:ABC transporter ATP-binding protein [Pseudochryseolinea flava]RAV99339.1 ABC transporter ATP-binding protein [Pseudochryseolinea flava]
MNTEGMLVIKDLSVGYGAHKLFEHISLTLHRGEFICLMGPNGIGKSSLIRTIAGLQKPLAGQVKIDHDNIRAHSLAVVLTDRITAQNLTAHELINLGRYPYLTWRVKLTKQDHAIIEQAIEQVGIQELKNRRVQELSDGQLQLVMIARALAQNTPVIVLDEPTAHLDLNNRLEIMKLLKNIAHQQNKGVLVSTHDLDLALQTADGIWLTQRDKTILTGFPEDLVLNNAFDTIFQLKGFDLKTGKVVHDYQQSLSVTLDGDGYSFLWTKNALERNGIGVSPNSGVDITIQSHGDRFVWLADRQQFDSLQDLVHWLISAKHV